MVHTQRILVADIGGTSSRFAAFTVAPAGLCLDSRVWLRTDAYETFEELLKELQSQHLEQALTSFALIVLAVAGPVTQGRYCSPPNIHWSINLDSTEKVIQLPEVILINDFLAQAYATVSPLAPTFERVLTGQIELDFPRAIVGVGTGLGKAALVPDGRGDFIGIASEGGHSALATESPDEAQLLEFFRRKRPEFQEAQPPQYVSWEHILSGRGLELTHEFITGNQCSAVEVAAELHADSPTLELFARVYGRMCRNFAFEFYARGGVFVAGGVAAKNPQILHHPAFAQAFRSTAAHSEVFANIPLYLIDNQDSGLWGAATLGQQRLRWAH